MSDENAAILASIKKIEADSQENKIVITSLTKSMNEMAVSLATFFEASKNLREKNEVMDSKVDQQKKELDHDIGKIQDRLDCHEKRIHTAEVKSARAEENNKVRWRTVGVVVGAVMTLMIGMMLAIIKPSIDRVYDTRPNEAMLETISDNNQAMNRALIELIEQMKSDQKDNGK